MQLHGFNFLSKSLAISIYNVSYIDSKNCKQRYIKEINTTYCANKLSSMLADIAQRIGCQVLNTATKNYRPQGASATLMIAEEIDQHIAYLKPFTAVSHLDKSHLCIHTYPEELFSDNIAIFRADIELSSCGLISPLSVLNYIINELQPDVTNIDYRIRGYSRLASKDKQFNDHDMHSIQEFLSTDVLSNYLCRDQNIKQANLFHTSLMTQTVNNKNIYQYTNQQLNTAIEENIKSKLMTEITTIFKG